MDSTEPNTVTIELTHCRRRFTRLTNGYSKKVEYHLYAVALHVMWINFCRPSMALSKGKQKVTPAMSAGLTDRVWTAEDILNLMLVEAE